MRSVFRSVFVALVAVLAVGAVASASALAAPSWEVQEGGVWKTLGSGESRNVVSESASTQILEGTGLIPAETLCEKVKDKGRITNTTSGGSGEVEKIEYTGCKVVKPAACQVKSPGGKAGIITTVAGVKTKLVELAGGVGDKFYAGTEKLGELEFGTTENPETHKFEEACGLVPRSRQGLKGDVVAKVEGAGKLEFTNPAQLGSTLQVGASEFRIVGEVSQALEGGGAIRAS